MDLEQELALESIEAWAQSVGRPHLDFACHAAFPLALTPDLLYHMWVNFQRNVAGRRLEIPWMAVPDLLLSALCRESSGESYRMEEPVRDELLRRLATDERFGSQRVQELAEFLRAYVRRQQLSANRYEQQFAEAQRLTALAYTDPGALVAVMADAYVSGGLERNQLMRLDALLHSYAGPLTSWVPAGDDVRADFERLQQYGANMGRWVRGDRELAAETLQALAGTDGRVRIAHRTLPLPQGVAPPRTPRPHITYQVDLTQPGTFSAAYQGQTQREAGSGTLHWNEENEPELWSLAARAMRGSLDGEGLARLGQALFERVVPDLGQFLAFYQEGQKSGNDLGIALAFNPDVWPEIASVPLELMAMPESLAAGASPFAAAPGFTLLRIVHGFRPPPSPPSLAPDEPLRILVAWGNAVNLQEYGLPALDVDREQQELESALARHGSAAHLSFLAEARPDALHAALSEQQPHVLHLRAHIRSNATSPTEPPALALTGHTGEVQWVDAPWLEELLSGAQTGLVLLDPGVGGREYDFVQLMAARLAAANLPAVAGLQFPLSARARQTFFFQLYQGLLHEMPAAAAVQAARRALAQSGQEAASFAAPFLYTRLLERPLFAREVAPAEEAATAEASERREGRKFALLIGHTRYKNDDLSRIAVPGHDITILAAVLADPAIGGFDPDDVTTLFDAGAGEMRRAIADFMADRMPDDLLFLYIAGAGLVDPGQQLYLAAADSDPAHLWETFVSAADVQREMNRSRARRQLLVLDCANVAFNTVAEKGGRDLTAQRRPLQAFESAAESEGPLPEVERVILGAGDSVAYVLEGGRLSGESPPSYFTRYLVDGLGTGAADLNRDGQITVDELYEYLLQRTQEQERYQTPSMWRYGQRDPLVIARSGADGPTQEAPAPDEAAPPFPSPLDFSAWITSHASDFTNREEELARIAAWTRNPEAPPLLLLAGRPGSGKTALASHLVQISSGQAEPPEQVDGLAPGFLGADHFCYLQDPRTLDPRTFVDSLATQLANRFAEYREAVAPLFGDETLQYEPAEKAIYPLILDSLSRMERDLPVIVLVDALDEAQRHRQRPTIIDLLQRLLAEAPPRTLCVLATTRPEPEVLDVLKPVPQERYELQPLTSAGT